VETDPNSTMTAAEFREYQATGRLPERIRMGDKKSSKYKNVRTDYNGEIYDSKHESNRAAELVLMARAKEVVQVFEQVPFRLPGNRVYKADFVILWPDGTWTVEDAKGVRTPEYKIKRDLMLDTWGIKIKEV